MTHIDTKAKARELLKKNFGTQRRVFQLDVRQPDAKDDNIIKLSASSNKPDLRFIDTGEEFVFGNEILSHKPKHLTLSRIEN